MEERSAAWAVKPYSVVKTGMSAGVIEGKTALSVLLAQREEEELRFVRGCFI